MPTVVQNTADLDEVSAQGVVDRERKPTNGSTPEHAVDDAIHSWHGGDQAEGVIEFRLELRPQAGTLRFIPRKSLRDIRRGFGSEFKPIRHDPLAVVELGAHLLPRESRTRRWIVKPTVELLFVPIGNRYVLGCKAVPNVLEQLEALLGRESEDLVA